MLFASPYYGNKFRRTTSAGIIWQSVPDKAAFGQSGAQDWIRGETMESPPPGFRALWLLSAGLTAMSVDRPAKDDAEEGPGPYHMCLGVLGHPPS